MPSSPLPRPPKHSATRRSGPTTMCLLPTSRPEPFGNVLESLTTLSYLAASTSRIGLGTGILVLPQRDPVLVAKQAATISHLSGGRLAMAVGVGYIKEEYCYLRADFSNRGHLADEYISATRELFESERPEFHGPHINYSDVLFSPRPSPRIPILVGGDSTTALKRAATLGDGWYGLWQSPDQVRAAIAQINAIGRKAQFEVSVRVLTVSEAPFPTAILRPPCKARSTQSSSKSSAIATPVSIESSSNSCLPSWTTFCV